MTVIVALKKGRDQAGFRRAAARAKVRLQPVRGLPCHFICDEHTVESFPLGNHPAVRSVEDGEAEIHGLAFNEGVLGRDMLGFNWGLARHVRRDTPWNRDNVGRSTPYPTYFRSERDGTGVDIYVVDTGFRLTHVEIAGRATNVWEGVTSGGAGDDNGHGTGVAAIAAGLTTGPARGALLWSFKVLNSAGSGTTATIVSGIGQALSHYQGRAGTNRPAVMNISIGGAGSDAVAAAIEDCVAAGMVVVAAAGNNMLDMRDDPSAGYGRWPDVVCAGGCAVSDEPYFTPPFGTNSGRRVDLLAAAQRQMTANFVADDAYFLFNGTSGASPMIAGIAACLLTGHARLTSRHEVQAMRKALIEAATTGRLRNPYTQVETADGVVAPLLPVLPDRIAYLDPNATAPVTLAPKGAVVGGGDTAPSLGTSTTASFPTGIAAGDACFAFVMHRSTVTPPAGWTYVTGQQVAPDFGLGIRQVLSVYRRVYEAGDGASATFTQAQSDEFCAHIVAIRPGAGNKAIVIGSAYGSHSGNGDHPIPVVTATADSQIALHGSCCVLAQSSGETLYQAADGATLQTSDASTAKNRLCVSWTPLDTGEQSRGVHWHNPTSHAGAELSLLVKIGPEAEVEPPVVPPLEMRLAAVKAFTVAYQEPPEFQHRVAAAKVFTVLKPV